jgi:phosphoglucosamine mutase
MGSRALFGTDGVRGVANRDLTPDLALAIGRAFGSRLGQGARVIIGRDTRRSGPMLEAALAAGLASAGVHVDLAGVVPTPAVAELVARSDATGGAVISASHNPFMDNGIKLFGPEGFKLADDEEAAIEAAMAVETARPDAEGVGEVRDWPAGRDHYVELALERFPLDLSGMRLVIDCANGATTTTAPEILGRLGAALEVIGGAPDGVNINQDCGSTSLGALQATVAAGRHDLGLAFDGDGDRVLAVDHEGTVVDGDQILAVLARDLKEAGRLPGDAVVTTTMTNLGFRRAMVEHGIEVRWTDVGDRYVLEEMRRGGYVLGGEQSGHLINLDMGPTGDGLAAGLQLLGSLRRRGQSLAEAGTIMRRLPQRLVSVRVARKEDLHGADEVWELVRRFEEEFGEEGRVVVRASGTEPLVRVMVEAPTERECSRWCETMAAAAIAALGEGGT